MEMSHWAKHSLKHKYSIAAKCWLRSNLFFIPKIHLRQRWANFLLKGPHDT